VGDFYILCPDNDVPRSLDEKRMAWAIGDIIENRPPLSRWHPDWAEAFRAVRRGRLRPRLGGAAGMGLVSARVRREKGRRVKVLILETAEAAAARVAEIVAAALAARPAPVLGLATGETMRPVYARLVALHREAAPISPAPRPSISTNMSECRPTIPPPSPPSCARRSSTMSTSTPRARTCRRATRRTPRPRPRRYEAAIAAAGGIDLQLLGIGRNGHLAFNEPTSSLASRTRIKTLTEATRNANAPAFAPDPVPRHAITMGIATILDARACLLLATGEAKAAAVARMVEGPLGADCPATALQMHRTATVVLDAAAASRLGLREYYETVHPGGTEAILG
jgi:glucosamine-6-phosphate deaminase